ncbi:hypothetical protein WH47_02102 [Habropoda laboriosa]|uniref:Uncharacterized protein n=1 Tax=Habropoda laboriosa TaxID=597456 RepID=A0A0L7RJE0_9HYME|nr:hypothetical protein WH47_02102 [Habropoda laboriosa]
MNISGRMSAASTVEFQDLPKFQDDALILQECLLRSETVPGSLMTQTETIPVQPNHATGQSRYYSPPSGAILGLWSGRELSTELRKQTSPVVEPREYTKLSRRNRTDSVSPWTTTRLMRLYVVSETWPRFPCRQMRDLTSQSKCRRRRETRCVAYSRSPLMVAPGVEKHGPAEAVSRVLLKLPPDDVVVVPGGARQPPPQNLLLAFDAPQTKRPRDELPGE